MRRLLIREAHLLTENPPLLFQKAVNQPDHADLCRVAHRRWENGLETRPWLRWKNKPEVESACLRTLKLPGRTWEFSPTDRLLAVQIARDSLLILDLETGEATVTLSAPGPQIGPFRFSADGRYLVVLYRKYNPYVNVLRAWDPLSGELVSTLDVNEERINGLTAPPDGGLMTSYSDQGAIRTWELGTGENVDTLHVKKTVHECSFTPDGTYLVTRGPDRPNSVRTEIKVWSVDRREMLRSALCTERKGSVAMHGRRIAFLTDDDKVVCLWDPASGEQLAYPTGHRERLQRIAFTPDGQRLLTVANGVVEPGTGEFKLWDLTGREVASGRFSAGGGPTDRGNVNDFAFSRDSSRVVIASQNKILQVWNPVTGSEVSSLRGHRGWVLTCSFSPDARFVYSTSEDRSIKVWDTESGKLISTLLGHNDKVTESRLSRDGRRLVTISEDNRLKIWDCAAALNMTVRQNHAAFVTDCQLGPGHRILSASEDRTLKVWDAETGGHQLTLTGHTQAVRTCAFSPDGQLLVSGSSDVFFFPREWESIRVWDARDGTVVREHSVRTNGVKCCVFSPDGRRLVAACRWGLMGARKSWSGEVLIWDAATGQRIQTLPHPSVAPISCGYSPDGHKIVTGFSDGTLRTWSALGYEHLATLEGHRNFVTSCTFSPDGRHVLSGSEDGTCRLWDAETGAELSKLTDEEGGVVGVAFSPSGNYVTCVHGGVVLVLEMTDRQVVCRFPVESGATGIAWNGRFDRLVVGNNSGQLVRLELVESRPGLPWATARRLFRHDTGMWDAGITAACSWCGESTAVDAQTLVAIEAAAVSDDRPRFVEGECAECRGTLRFNPFLVDNAELEPAAGGSTTQ